MYKKIILAAALVLAGTSMQAQKNKPAASNDNGGISTEMMQQIKKSYGGSASDKAMRNIMVNQSPAKLAMNY